MGVHGVICGMVCCGCGCGVDVHRCWMFVCVWGCVGWCMHAVHVHDIWLLVVFDMLDDGGESGEWDVGMHVC